MAHSLRIQVTVVENITAVRRAAGHISSTTGNQRCERWYLLFSSLFFLSQNPLHGLMSPIFRVGYFTTIKVVYKFLHRCTWQLDYAILHLVILKITITYTVTVFQA